MIREVIRWFRVVLPPRLAIGVLLLACAVIDSLYLWVRYGLQLPAATEPFTHVRSIVIGIACAVYGLFRAQAFHPLSRPEYRKWLELTPWTVRKPLPLGPIHLVAQDIVVVGLLLAFLHTLGPINWHLASAFLFAYLLSLCASLSATGERWTAYVLLFGLGAAVRLLPDPLVALACLGLLYPIAYRALLRSLARFPWDLPWWWDSWEAHQARLKPAARNHPQLQSRLGWPFDLLQPSPPKERISLLEGNVIGLLAGWWAYAIFAVAREEAYGFLTAALYLAPVQTCLIGRVMQYCACYWPPISLWGRIWTGRWIIPGYDTVLVAPILAAVAAVGVPLGLWMLGVPIPILFPVSLAAVLSITLCLPPTLKDWQLTGAHRIVPVFQKNAKNDFFQL